MENQHDEANEYNTSEVDWGDQTSHHPWDGGSDYEDEYELETWSDETYSEVWTEEEGDEPEAWTEDDSQGDFEEQRNGEDMEPEPPDNDQNNRSHQSCYEANHEEYEEEAYERDSWCEENDFGISEESRNYEAESEGDLNEESIFNTGVEEQEHANSMYQPDETNSEADEDELCSHLADDEESYEPRYISFSGREQGLEAYMRWERDMEDWFQSNQIPEEEKTSYAEDTLTEDAFRSWEQDACIRLEYGIPDSSWEEMKQILYKEFVEDAAADQQYYSRAHANSKPRRVIFATRQKSEAQLKNHCCSKPQRVLSNTSEESKAKTKPTATAKNTQPESNSRSTYPKQSSKASHELQGKPEQCKASKFSKSKEIICYRCQGKGHFAATCPSRKVVKITTLESEAENDQNEKLNVLASNSTIIHLSLPKGIDTGPTKEQKDKEPEEGKDPLEKVEQPEEQKEAKKCFHTKRKQGVDTSDILFQEEPPDPTPPARNHAQDSGVIMSFLRKGGPENVPTPIRQQKYQGKVLDSQRRMQANLLSLGAGCIVSRSKLIQGGGYDEDIKSSSTVEQGNMRLGVESMKLKRAKEAGQDVCQFNMPYLISQEDFDHETNFIGFFTHQCSNTKWNQRKICPDQKDTDFTKWRFSSPSISKSHILEDESSPILIRSTPNLPIGLKMGLSAFNKAQNEEEWPSKYEDMTQLSKPVKSVLHLSDLESHRFSLNQTKQWRQGEVSNHLRSISNGLGGVEEFLACTRTHMIRRISLFRSLPNMDAFTFWRISDPRPSHQRCCVLKALYTSKEVPRIHYFLPKLTRYKDLMVISISGQICSIRDSNGHITYCFDSFSCFSFLGLISMSL